MKMVNFLVLVIILLSFLLIISFKPQITGLQIDPIDNNETGLVALWHLNEGSGTMISDSSGNGNTGTISGATWIDGKFGKALSFDGVDDYVNVPDSVSLHAVNEYTFEFWFNTKVRYYSGMSPDWNTIISYPNFLQIFYRGAYTSLRPLIYQIGGFSNDGPTYTYEKDTWYHWALTINKTHFSIYINGVQYGPYASSFPDQNFRPPSGNLNIGNNVFNGTFDEIAIYNRALSASEILNHYNKGMGGGGDTTSPTVFISHSPSTPNTTTSVTLTSTASDNVGVTGINIYVDGASKKTCTSSPCSTTAQTYSLGNHTYYATASDAAGNSGRDPSSGTKSFTVSTTPTPAQCGNNVKETGETCDGTDSSACPGQCTVGCTCQVPTNFSGVQPGSLRFTEKFRGKVIVAVNSVPYPRGGPNTTEGWIAQLNYMGADGAGVGMDNWDTNIELYRSALKKYKDAGLLTVLGWNNHGLADYYSGLDGSLTKWSMANQDKQMVQYWRVYVDTGASYATAYDNGRWQVSYCVGIEDGYCSERKTDLPVTQNPDGSITIKIKDMRYHPVYDPVPYYNVSSVYAKYPASDFSWAYDESGVSYNPSDTQYEQGRRLAYGSDYEIFIQNNVIYAKIYNPNNRKLNLYVLFYSLTYPSVFFPEGREQYFGILRSLLGNFSPYVDAYMQNDGGFMIDSLNGDFHPEIIKQVESKYGIDFNFDNWEIYPRVLYDLDSRYFTQYVFARENYLIFKNYSKERQDIEHSYGVAYIPTASDVSGMVSSMITHSDALLVNTYDDWQYKVSRWASTGIPTGWTPSTQRLGTWIALMIYKDTPGDYIVSFTKESADELLKWNPDGGTIYYWDITDNQYNYTNRLDAFKEAIQYMHDKFKNVNKLPLGVERHIVAKSYPLSYTYRYGDNIDLNPGQIDYDIIYTKDLKWDSVPTDGCLVPFANGIVGGPHTDDTVAHEKIRQAVNSGSGIAFPAAFWRTFESYYTGTSIPQMYKDMFKISGWLYPEWLQQGTREKYISDYLTFDGLLNPVKLNSTETLHWGAYWLGLQSGTSPNVIIGEYPSSALHSISYGSGKAMGVTPVVGSFSDYYTDAKSATYGDEYLVRFVEECAGKKGSFRLWDVGKTYLYKLSATTYYALLVERYGISRDVPIIVYGASDFSITDMDTNGIIQNGSTIHLNAESSKLLKISLGSGEEQLPTPPLGCQESWTCGDWSSCVNNLQTRTCTDENACGTTNDKPATSQSCQSCQESWLCSEWSNCTNSIQTRTCTDNNNCDTTLSKPQENQTCEMPSLPQQIIENIVGSEASVGPSGVMGGTSFGGSMGSSVVSAIAQVRKIKYSFNNLPIYEISFTTSTDLTNSKISIEDLGNIKPQTINLIPDGLLYRYVTLTKSNIDDKSIDDIKINFKVPLSFYKNNGIDPRKTSLQKWDGSKWERMDTIQIGSDTTTYYFESSSSSLSIFAITAEITGLLPPSTTCNTFCEEGEALNVDTCTCSAVTYNLKGLLSPKNLPYISVVIVILGIIIIFAFLKRR
jgi:PGF-pre-PGF domain-containing protein